MQTLVGAAYTPPTPEEMQAYIRRAHMERAQALSRLWTALFRHRKANEPTPGATPTCARPA